MTAKKNAGMFKLIYLSFIGLLILQLLGFLVVKYFSYIINQQMVFGLIGNNYIANLVSIIILITLIYLFYKKFLGLEIVLLSAGLISNILDRLIYKGVIDYLSIFFIPKFNLADILIVAGAGIITYKIIRTI